MARATRGTPVPHIVVLYGTTEGHSAKIAASIGDTLRGEGLKVDVADAAESPPDAEAYDGAVIVASVHAGEYRSEVVDWARRHARALNAVPGAFVSVSLGELQDDPKVKQDLEAIRGRFLDRTGWKPGATLSIAGALPYSRYNLLTRAMMKRVAAQAGADTDTGRDYEYTDWKAVQRFTRRFATKFRP